MAVQEHHDLADRLLLGPGGRNAAGSYRTDSVHLPQATRLRLDVGVEVLRNRALNCWPWARSLTQLPDAVTHSPAEIAAAWPTKVTRSRWPRALIRTTQKPFSAFW